MIDGLGTGGYSVVLKVAFFDSTVYAMKVFFSRSKQAVDERVTILNSGGKEKLEGHRQASFAT